MTFAERLTQTSPLLLDGAMGTQLDAMGLAMSEENNLSHPEAVAAIHTRYVESGCDILITNTFTVNRLYVETHALGLDVREINRAGVKLARAAATSGHYVLGDIGSTGQLLAPYGTYAEAQFFEAFTEQATVLAEAGVDGFIVETMMDLREALCAVRAMRACRAVASLPILVSLAFRTPRQGGRTLMGNGAEESARALVDAGASAVGANCGDVDPVEMAEIIAIMKGAVSAPILAQPNAGRPRVVNGKTVFDMTPEEFARGVAACLQAGASLVGGCCGTSPAHIRQVAKLLHKTTSDAPC
jgi:5-methyltetrahydrofolate--homocysteine methyltransferase